MTFEELAFRHPWRRYQAFALGQLDEALADDRVHLVAPPGSGKTVLGIELIRRFDRWALVLAPTTAIQRQWAEAVALFTDPDRARHLVSTDPLRPAPITIVTYQAISTTSRAGTALTQLAEQRWADELVRAGRLDSADDALARIALLRRENEGRYRREVARRTRAARRALLRDGGVDVGAFLHPSAQDLLERFVASDVGTVVLDECHHLLEHWAYVVRALLDRLDRVRVVGLTATLPSPDDPIAFDTYTGLLGDVDVDVPTPAVVREGDLAPYRDLVHFVTPSARERVYLDDIQRHFDAAIRQLLDDARFRSWVATLAITPRDADGMPTTLATALQERPVLTLAALRLAVHIQLPLDPSVPLPTDARRSATLDDWLAVLEEYALEVLAVSADPTDHQRLVVLRRALLGYGLTLGERGIRRRRAPADVVLTFSEAKDVAALDILAAEERALGAQLRAIVVTDFERLSSAATRSDGVLAEDAGSAHRVFHRAVHDPRTRDLEPILVTGRTLLVDADHGPAMLEHFNQELARRQLSARVRFRDTDDPAVLEVVGHGEDWGPGVYVAIVTAAFERGTTRLLVGTRGLLGEGWDSLRLNTLIDLTSATTSTSVQQLRGRAIRRDPTWPRKLAHNWDVVCVAPQFERGEADLDRFVRKHDRYWGVAVTAQEPLDDEGALRPATIVRGVAHVDPVLAWDLSRGRLGDVDLDAQTRRSLRAVDRRDHSYDLWGVGQPYTAESAVGVHVDPAPLDLVTAGTLAYRSRSFLAAIAGLVAAVVAIVVGPALLPAGAWAGAAVAGGVLAGFAAAVRAIGVALHLRAPPEPREVLADVARAVHAGLRAVGDVGRDGLVRILPVTETTFEVRLDEAPTEDREVFGEAFADAIAPVETQRYLVDHQLRRDRRPLVRRTARWSGAPLRRLPVPDALARNRERADAYAAAFARWVGGDGALTYTRGEGGAEVLLAARAQVGASAPTLQVETWG